LGPDPLLLTGMAFAVGFVDVVFGMGYGTVLTPLLIMVGIPPLKAVPSVVFSQFFGSVPTTLLHRRAGNLGRSDLDLKIALTLGLGGFAAPLAAYFVAVNVPPLYLKLYLSALLLSVGSMLLLDPFKGARFSWRRMVLLSFVAGFNKGFTGGGYGPLVTSGQVLSGIDSRSAVAITPLARGMACVTTVAAYALGGGLDLGLTLPLTLGVLLSTPLAVHLVRRSGSGDLKRGVGTVALLLGIMTLAKAFSDGW